MKLSPWLPLPNAPHCCARIFPDTNINIPRNRVALIEKTPRVMLRAGTYGITREFASGYYPGTLGVFTLTPRQLKSFEGGKLALVPQGFCSPMHSNYLGGETILHVGPVKSCKEVEEIFQKHLDRTAQK